MPSSPTDSWVKVIQKTSCACSREQANLGPFRKIGKETCPTCETRESAGSYFHPATNKVYPVISVPSTGRFYIEDPEVESRRVTAEGYLAEFGWYSYILLPKFHNGLLPDGGDPDTQYIIRIESRTQTFWSNGHHSMTPHPNVSHGGTVCYGTGNPPNPTSELSFLSYMKNLFGTPGWGNPYESYAATRAPAASISYKGVGDRQPWKELDLVEWAFAPGCHSFYSVYTRQGRFNAFSQQVIRENDSVRLSPCANCAMTTCPANITAEQRAANPSLYNGSDPYLPRIMPGSMFYLVEPLVDPGNGYLSHLSSPQIQEIGLPSGFRQLIPPNLEYPPPIHPTSTDHTLTDMGLRWCYLPDDHPLRMEFGIDRAAVR